MKHRFSLPLYIYIYLSHCLVSVQLPFFGFCFQIISHDVACRQQISVETAHTSRHTHTLPTYTRMFPHTHTHTHTQLLHAHRVFCLVLLRIIVVIAIVIVCCLACWSIKNAQSICLNCACSHFHLRPFLYLTVCVCVCFYTSSIVSLNCNYFEIHRRNASQTDCLPLSLSLVPDMSLIPDTF